MAPDDGLTLVLSRPGRAKRLACFPACRCSANVRMNSRSTSEASRFSAAHALRKASRSSCSTRIRSPAFFTAMFLIIAGGYTYVYPFVNDSDHLGGMLAHRLRPGFRVRSARCPRALGWRTAAQEQPAGLQCRNQDDGRGSPHPSRAAHRA